MGVAVNSVTDKSTTDNCLSGNAPPDSVEINNHSISSDLRPLNTVSHPDQPQVESPSLRRMAYKRQLSQYGSVSPLNKIFGRIQPFFESIDADIRANVPEEQHGQAKVLLEKNVASYFDNFTNTPAPPVLEDSYMSLKSLSGQRENGNAAFASPWNHVRPLVPSTNHKLICRGSRTHQILCSLPPNQG
jgi:hypothetical protein